MTYPDVRAVRPVINALQDKDENVRNMATRVLRRVEIQVNPEEYARAREDREQVEW